MATIQNVKIDRSKLNFYMKSVQSTVFKTLIDACKEIVADANLIFDKKGLLIKTVDESYNAMIYLRLNGNKFEEYYCKDISYTCGIALLNMHKLLKTMSSSDVLTIYQYEENPNRLELIIENNKKAKMSKFKLHLLDLQKPKIKSFQPEFEHAISIDSSEFHKIIREMKDISNKIDIQCYGKTLRFKSVDGLFADGEILLAIKEEKDANIVVQGIFDLKFLSTFTKCTPLSKSVHLYLKNDFPLIVQYDVNDLGHIQLVLMMEQEQ